MSNEPEISNPGRCIECNTEISDEDDLWCDDCYQQLKDSGYFDHGGLWYSPPWW